MKEAQLKEIEALEKELSFLIKEGMTLDEKLKALADSYWRAHNSGYCDHIAGMLMGGIENGETRRHDLDCHYKWEVTTLFNLLTELKEEG